MEINNKVFKALHFLLFLLFPFHNDVKLHNFVFVMFIYTLTYNRAI